MKKIRKLLAVPVLTVLLFVMTQVSAAASTDTICIIKVPMDAVVIVKDVTLSDANLVKVSPMTGRIHEIASANLGITGGYKQYMVNYFVNPSDVQVFTKDLLPMEPSNVAPGLIEYLSADTYFEAQVSERVCNAAIAYHNRVGGYGGNNFGKYFLQGQEAYQRIVGSDQCRKWGQPARAGIIASVNILELTKYSEQAFTAKVEVHATNGSGYDEIYTISFLFQHTGKDFYVTHFTYMP